MNKLRGVTLPKKWLTFDEIKDKVTYPTSQNKIEQLEKYIEVREQECDDLQDRIDKAVEYINEAIEDTDIAEVINTDELLDILQGDNK